MSDLNHEEQIEKIVFVVCIRCERAMQPALINIKESYPASLIVNQWMMGKFGKPTPIPVPIDTYLCAKHYQEEISK